MRISPSFTKISCFVLLCSLSNIAAASNATDQSVDADVNLSISKAYTLPDVILISPEWRSTDSQQVSKTVNHFSADELDASGIRDTIGLQYKTPGLIFKTNAVLGQPYLRGVGNDVISAGAEPSVATFVDGINLPRAFDAIVDFYDVERVEVIKGPQGVHLGRNVVGGAISIHTMDPEPRKAAYADILLGNYNKRQFRGMLNTPVADTDLSLRLATTASQRDGYSQNIFLGQDVDSERFYALRGKLKWQPSTQLSLILGAEHHSEDSTRAMAPHLNADVGVNGGIALGGIVPSNPRELTSNTEPSLDVESTRYSSRLNWRSDVLEFNSITAYLQTKGEIGLDLDGTNVDFAANFPNGSSETLSQEFRLWRQQNERLSWLAGLLLLREQANQSLDVRLPLSGIRNHPEGAVDTYSSALFGQIDYDFNSHWRGKVGIRYSRDKRTLDLTKTVSSPAGTSISTQNEQQQWQAWTPELGIEYSPASNSLYYTTVARGYKAGGYNTNNIQPAFNSEFLTAYEIGMKRTLLQQRLKLNAALFYYDYRDMQLDTPPAGAPVGTFPSVINAARSSITGMDIDAQLQASQRLDLQLSSTLLDGRFDEFSSIDPNNSATDPDRSGNRLPQAPILSLNMHSTYRIPLEAGELSIWGGYRYQTEVYFNVYQDPAVRQGGYGLLNAGLTFESWRGDWYAEGYILNITDKLYAQTIIRRDPLVGTKRYWGAPRTLGFRLGYHW